MIRIGIFLFCVLSALFLSAQVEFDEERMSANLLEAVNDYRESQQLPALKQDEILDAVAFDQAAYISKSGKLVHEQEQGKKKTLIDRILYYEGLNAKAGENISSIDIGSKVKLEGGEKAAATSPDIVIRAAIFSWLSEEDGRLNLNDPEFSLFGSSVLQNDKNELILVLVLANLPYQDPSGGKPQFNHEGVSKYKEEDCKSFLTEYPSLAPLFSDAFVVEGNEVFFEFHNLALVEQVLSDGGDGIGVDIIGRNQFSCTGSNRLFPGSIHDGYILNPAKKGKLNLNSKKEEGAVKISIGELPDFYTAADYEINGFLVKNGSHCLSIPYNKMESHSEKWMGFPMLFASPNLDSVVETIDTSFFEFPYSELESNLEDLELYMRGLDYSLDDVIVDGLTGPIALGLQDKPLRSKLHQTLDPYFRTEPYVNIEIEQSWAAYEAFKKGTYYQLETKGMSKEQELQYLAETVQKDDELKAALEGMNRVKLLVSGKLSANPDLSQADRLKLFRFLLDQDNIPMALEIQRQLIETAVAEQAEIQFLLDQNQKQVKETLPLINNQILAQDLIKAGSFDGNKIHTALLELYLVDPNNAIVSYNYHMALLRYWSKNSKRIDDIQKWKKQFERLRGKSEVSKQDYSRAYLNYLMIAADYYYEKQIVDKRKKSFDELLRQIPQANLNQKELLFLAQYLCFQDQLTLAVKALLPIIKKGDVDRDLMFFFLQIARYETEQVSEAQYADLMNQAKKEYPKDFCSLFSKDRMGIQVLEIPGIKALYCEHCK